MSQRLLRVAKWLAYPAFYLFCLGLFGYLTFPYGRVKDRLVAEVEKRGKPGQRLEIGGLSSYWFTGVELTDVKLHLPPEESPPSPGASFGAAPVPAKESVVSIDEVHVRVKILPLLLGRVRVSFWASAFGGEIKGTAPVGDSKGDVEVELDHVDIGKIEPIAQAVGVPLKGIATGKLALAADDGKFTKASGTLDFTISDVVVSDGKTKLQGLIVLPAAKLGEIVLSAEAKDGVLKINKLAANGADLDFAGDGKITLKEPWTDAIADLYVRFKFTDGYRGKNDTTKSLLGEPGSTGTGLIEVQVPKMKRAKRSDGFFGWHIHGPLKRLKFDPSTADYAPSTAGAGGKRKVDSPFGAAKRPMPTPGLPLGVSTAKAHDEDKAASPPTHPAPAFTSAPGPPPGVVREPATPEPPSRRGAPPEVPPPPPPPPAPPPPPPPPPAPAPEPYPEQPMPGMPDQPGMPEQPMPGMPDQPMPDQPMPMPPQ